MAASKPEAFAKHLPLVGAAVYFACDARTGRVLYVGQASNLLERVSRFFRRGGIRVYFVPLRSKDDPTRVEAAFIRYYCPPENRDLPSIDRGDAERVLRRFHLTLADAPTDLEWVVARSDRATRARATARVSRAWTKAQQEDRTREWRRSA